MNRKEIEPITDLSLALHRLRVARMVRKFNEEKKQENKGTE